MTSDLPEAFFRNRLSSPALSVRPGAFDVGMVQLDSIRVDVGATLERVVALYDRRDELVAREAEFLRRRDVGLVASDIPALPLEAAAAAGIPRLAVGNFGWDWIYEPFVERDRRWGDLVERIARGYAEADLLLRLPFAEEMRAFRRIEDLPLLASPGKSRRSDVLVHTGCRPDRKWVLLSFTALLLDDAALDRIERLEEYEFFTFEPLTLRRRNIHPIDRRSIPFADVLASIDGVVSKPGFGIVSECVANGKPLAYADRTDFREYELLVAAIRRHLRSVHLPSARLYAGDLAECLEALWEQPQPSARLGCCGAEIAARRIAEYAGY